MTTMHRIISFRRQRKLFPFHNVSINSLTLNRTRRNWTSRAAIERKARASGQRTLVNTANARTSHTRQRGAKLFHKRRQRSSIDVQASDEWQLSKSELSAKADRVLGGLLGSIGAIGEGSWVDGRVAVDSALVAADGENLGGRLRDVQDVGLKVGNGVFVGGVALVPRRALVVGQAGDVAGRG